MKVKNYCSYKWCAEIYDITASGTIPEMERRCLILCLTREDEQLEMIRSGSLNRCACPTLFSAGNPARGKTRNDMSLTSSSYLCHLVRLCNPSEPIIHLKVSFGYFFLSKQTVS